ncbi:MAG: type II secretion system protein GspG [Planctomycetes bacterium]|nr:type II secretion system protein GspG [Planctomycetota bacterium]
MRKGVSLRSGFSAVELVAATAIVLILAGVVVPAIGAKFDKAREARAITRMKTVAQAFNTYHAHTGVWPSNGTFDPSATTSEELLDYTCLYARPAGVAEWRGPYLTEGFVEGSSARVAKVGVAGPALGVVDPWDRPFAVHSFARGYDSGHGALVLVCRGANGVLDSTPEQLARGEPANDDLVAVVTRRL